MPFFAPAVMKPHTIWLLLDGKPGHENQSLGLAEAIARQSPCDICTVSLHGKQGWLKRIRTAVAASRGFPKPDLIIAAGHHTHMSLLWLARKYRTKSIVLMRPSLPMRWFDLCIAPAHDFPKPSHHDNLILTRGALNRVSTPTSIEKRGRLILIGGPSGTHGWDNHSLMESLGEITGEGSWRLTNSRRTPPGVMEEIGRRMPQIELFPHEDTDAQWLPSQLANAAEVWVTEDSVSMVYEALSSGARVGLLPLPRLKPASRVLMGLENLVADGFLTTLSDWRISARLQPPPEILQEADRCAGRIIQRFFL